MSEEQAQYKTQPEAVIDPPRTVKALQDGKVVDYKVWGWVKLSAKFLYHIKILKGAKLAIMMTLALSVDETGKCKLTIKQLCEITDYSHTEVIDSIKELSEMGYLSVQKDAKGNIYDPKFVARGGVDPSHDVVKKLESTGVESTGAYRVESSPSEENGVPSIKSIKRVNTPIPPNASIEWYIQHDLPVPHELQERARLEKDAPDSFEKEMGFGSLPWDSTNEWQKFKKWVVETYSHDKNVWADYAEWRKGKGKYEAMSNKQIRMNPAVFKDTGYPTFKAHTGMYNDDEKLRLL